MASQSWLALLNNRQQAINAFVKNTITVGTISPPPDISFGSTVPWLQPGDMYYLHASGRMSNTGTPTLKLGFYYGGVPATGVTLAESAAFTTITSTVNWRWEIDAMMTVLTIGTSGTIMCQGHSWFPTAANTSQFRQMPEVAPTTATVDTTVAKSLTVGATWSASSVSNTTTCDFWIVKALN